MRYLSRLCFSSLLVVVTACSQYPATTIVDGPYQSPPDAWQIKGKLGIRTNTDSGSAIIDWRQRKDHYSIRISGPFGQGSAWVRGNSQLITIEQTGRQSVTSRTPEKLLQETFGWVIPINDLRYWVQGIPNSNKVINKPIYTEEGMLATFEQSDWSISISRYKLIERWLLPRRIKVNRNNVQLTLAIREWQFPQRKVQSPSAL